jgi:superfamily II DNA/RNA helicase
MVTLLYFALFPVQVIIATPGRILDLMDKNVAIMDSCRILVLDEVNISVYFKNSYFGV